MTLFGWDASDFDWDRGPVDLGAARRDGIDFFTHKATEGTSVYHRRYGTALQRARDAGIPFLGAYVVIRSGSVPAQIDTFLSYVDAQTPWWRDHPGWFFQVDLEHWSYDKVSPWQGVVASELLRERTGRWVVLYAPQWAYGDTIPGADPLWASSYGGNTAGHFRQLYPGDGDGKRWQAYSGRTPVFLQYGSRAVIGGQGTCDVNAFRGSLDDLRTLITGGDAAAPVTTIEEDEGMKGALVETTDEEQNSQVRAWVDPVLGPVYLNLVSPEYVPVWQAQGFVGPAGGGYFLVPRLAELGQDFHAAQAAHLAALQPPDAPKQPGDTSVDS